METKYKRELNNTCLILELPVLYTEDYQIRMIQANQIPGLLPVTGKGVDGKSQYFYEISGKTSLRSVYEKAEMQKEELERFLRQFLHMIDQVQNYLLDINCILLEPEYIFWEEERYYFCYLPARREELCKAFHELTEYFVSKISHKEQEGILLAYELHKATMEENYNLEKIVKKWEKSEEPEEPSPEPYLIEESLEDDWIDYPVTEAKMLRETPAPWVKIRQKWKRKKENKWGDWEETIL